LQKDVAFEIKKIYVYLNPLLCLFIRDNFIENTVTFRVQFFTRAPLNVYCSIKVVPIAITMNSVYFCGGIGVMPISATKNKNNFISLSDNSIRYSTMQILSSLVM